MHGKKEPSELYVNEGESLVVTPPEKLHPLVELLVLVKS